QLVSTSSSGFVDYIITPQSGPCTGLPQTVRINVHPFPAAPIISVQGGSSPICPGQSLTLTSDQLFGNQWFVNGVAIAAPTGTNRSLVVSDSGSYNVVFTNSNGCSSTSAMTRIDLILVPTKPVITGLSAFCPGNSSRLRSNANSGNQWQLNGADITGATDTVLTAQFAGAYTVRLTNTTCAVVSDTFHVSVFPAPAQPSISGNNFLCSGDTGVLVASDASSWQWLVNNNPIPNQTNQTLTITNGGNFLVTIQDTNGCSATSNVYNVQGIPANPIPTISGLNSFCAGDSIILSTENQNPAWKNQWFKDGIALLNDTLRTLIVKSTGVYTVTLHSPRGCKSTSLPLTVTQRETPPTPTISGLSLICQGGTNTLTSSSAAGNIWFQDGVQITGANNNSYSATSAGSYTVQVINVSGCKAISQPFVLSNTTTPDVTATLQNPSTCGQANGSISLAVTGGSGQFQYTWSPVTGGIVQGIQNQTALSAGNYTVLVQDIQSGCSQIVAGMVLNDPAAFTATAQVTNVTSCAGDNGRINLDITGSNGPFTFSWTGPVSATSQNLTNIPAGTYAVRITETSTGCVFILDSIQVGNNQPPKPDIVSSGPLEFCTGDSIILSTSAVGPYQWARIGSGALTGQTTNQLTVKTSGLYYVRVANPAFPNCFSRSDTLAVIVNPLPANPNLNGGNGQICQGVSTSISTTSTLTKQWTLDGSDIPGATGQFLEVSTGGTYCLKVTDTNGCINSGNSCRTITVNPIPPVTTISGNTGFCPGGQTQLTATPFDSATYDYTWMRNNNFITFQDVQQINATIEGWYRIRVVNHVTDCRIFSDSVFISNFTAPPAPVISGSGNICIGGSTFLVSSPGVTYQWSFNGSPIPGANDDSLLVNSGGIYEVAITDGNGCSATSNAFVVSEIPPPTASVISGETSFCAGSSVILTASANSNYAWLFNGSALPNQDAQTITANQFGNYQVMVSNVTGCSDTSAVFTTIQGAANFALDTTIISTSCVGGNPQNNGSITVSPTGGSGNFTYQWTPALPASASQTNLAPGAYSVIVTDAGTGCTVAIQDLIIAPTPVISGTPVVLNDTRCDLDNGTITLNPEGAAGPFTFQWTGFTETTNTLSNLQAGNYEVKVTDQTSGCAQTFGNIVVSKPDTIVVSSTITQPSSCGSVGLISLQTSGGSGIYSFAWSGTGSGIVPNSAIQSNLSAGTYSVTVTDTVSKCASTLSNLILQENGTVAFEVVKQNPLSCGSNDGTASVVTGIQNAVYTWIQLPASTLTDTDSSVSGLSIGNYRVIIQAGTCIDSADFTLTSPGLVL
ncbi:MAG TPA: SprB repeat-containing protein, partial [Catalimonadaceae bacterium]|nr:SprB repeat-containing protein [Catalimonadaceae bacterium]